MDPETRDLNDRLNDYKVFNISVLKQSLARTNELTENLTEV